MPSPARPFAVQSYCFRNFKDNAEIARMVRAIGLERVELCGLHADFNDLGKAAEVARVYAAEGVSIVSIGVQTFVGAPGERVWFEWARAVGAGHISAHFQVESFATAVPQVREWAREFGMKVGIHTHGGYQFGGSPDVIGHLIALGAPEVGLCMDTAWVMQIGPHRGNPVQWAADFAGHHHGVHFKDFVFAPNGQWRDVVVGEGGLDLPAFLAVLDAGGYDGISVIEYEADPDDPVPALTRCVEAMQRVTSAG